MQLSSLERARRRCGAAGFPARFASGILAAVALSAAVVAMAPVPAAAQATGGGAIPDLSERERGFLFQRPKVTLSVRSGILFHRAGSDIFDFAFERFTLDRSDFRAITVGGEAAFWIGNRFEAVGTIEQSQVTQRSESRGWLEEDGSPIEQSTRLAVGPTISVGARAYLRPRGEEFGRLAWAPNRWNLFAGGGIGVSVYHFRQWGDFVNETTQTIFENEVSSKGRAFAPYLSGGANISVSTRTVLLLEGRYQWGRTHLQSNFTGFEPIDLAGLRTTLSIGYNL